MSDEWTASTMGRKGGSRKVKKGFASMGSERAREAQAKAVAARRAKVNAVLDAWLEKNVKKAEK